MGENKKKLSKGKKQLINILVVVLLVAITVIILFTSNELKPGDIVRFVEGCNPWLIVAAFGCMLLFILFEGLSLFVICRRLGYRTKFVSSIAYSSADVYYSALTPSASGGQPASAYYMTKDGVNVGGASFALLFNLIAYTAAVLILGAAAFIVRPKYFVSMSALSKTLVILGMTIQTLLLLFFLACITFHKAVLKVGNALISLLVKIRIVKKEEKWRGKLRGEVEKYHACFQIIKKHLSMFVWAILLNVAQRAAQILVTCFVCYAAAPEVSFLELFAMQTYVLVGYNCVPLPGGSGAFELLYLDIFQAGGYTVYPAAAMMVSRSISYYLCIVVSGVITLVYHIIQMKKTKGKQAEQEVGADSSSEGIEDEKHV